MRHDASLGAFRSKQACLKQMEDGLRSRGFSHVATSCAASRWRSSSASIMMRCPRSTCSREVAELTRTSCLGDRGIGGEALEWHEGQVLGSQEVDAKPQWYQARPRQVSHSNPACEHDDLGRRTPCRPRAPGGRPGATAASRHSRRGKPRRHPPGRAAGGTIRPSRGSAGGPPHRGPARGSALAGPAVRVPASRARSDGAFQTSQQGGHLAALVRRVWHAGARLEQRQDGQVRVNGVAEFRA